jgi:hypothetical protein
LLNEEREKAGCRKRAASSAEISRALLSRGERSGRPTQLPSTNLNSLEAPRVDAEVYCSGSASNGGGARPTSCFRPVCRSAFAALQLPAATPYTNICQPPISGPPAVIVMFSAGGSGLARFSGSGFLRFSAGRRRPADRQRSGQMSAFLSSRPALLSPCSEAGRPQYFSIFCSPRRPAGRRPG